MTQSVATLSACWTVLKRIDDVLKLLDQNTRDVARALKFLKTRAKSFLTAVSAGLGDQDIAPYEPAIKSFEALARDILQAANTYLSMSTSHVKDGQQMDSADMKAIILDLNKRLQLFFDGYTFESANSTQLNPSAFAQPLPPIPSSSSTLVPDDIQWAIMCAPEEPVRRGLFPDLFPEIHTTAAESTSPPDYSEATRGNTRFHSSNCTFNYISGDSVVHQIPEFHHPPITFIGRRSEPTPEADKLKGWQIALVVVFFPITVPLLLCACCCDGFDD